MRLFASILAGTVDLMESQQPTFRNLCDTRTRIRMLTDDNGNRKRQLLIDLDL